MNAFAYNESLGSAAPVARAEVLRDDEVEVWQASLDAPEADVLRSLQALLSADEQERANRFIFARDRRRFIAGRGILRVLLGKYLGVAPETLAFRYGANGKPALATGGHGPLHFNLAHSDDVALYAFARAAEVGIDVERIRDMADWARVGELSFPPAEFARVQAAPEAERMNAFFRAWTRQEAILKALGVGLGGVTPDAAQLRVHPLRPAPGFAGALAVGRDVRRLRMHVWAPEAPHPLYPGRPDLS